jgi:hypothetical protein
MLFRKQEDKSQPAVQKPFRMPLQAEALSIRPDDQPSVGILAMLMAQQVVIKA